MEKSTKINLYLSDANFIGWLWSRLQYLHGYSKNDEILIRLSKIKNNIELLCSQYSDNDLDKIISRYFVDFYLDHDESTSIGYSNAERDNLRNAIKQIIADVREHNIPKDILLK